MLVWLWPPCLPNNWCNNTINISAHIHTAIDLLPKCGRRRKRSRTRAACGAWLASSPSCGFLRDGREVHSSCEMKKYLWIMKENQVWVSESSLWGNANFLLPVVDTVWSRYLNSRRGAYGSFWNIDAPVCLIRKKTRHTWQRTTSNCDPRLTPRAPPRPRDLRSVALISSNFLQRANTSLSCHTCWDISQSKQTAFLLALFFPIVAQGPDWHNIQRRVGFTAAH